jgi:hypothetical protein
VALSDRAVSLGGVASSAMGGGESKLPGGGVTGGSSMRKWTHGSASHPPSIRRTGVVAVTLAVGLFGFGACSAISKVRTAVHDIRGNKATIDAFSTKMQSDMATTFEATYVTTGSAPATIIYAVQPPKGVAFTDTPSGGTGDTTPVHLVVNASGEFACSQSGSAVPWTCQKLGTADAATQNKLFDFYTPTHWIAFLRVFSLAAGIAGDKVSSSTMTVNGFHLNCVDFVAPGVPGTSTICSTAQGILGYVNVASSSTSFEIQAFSSSPPASLFELPPGATVTTTPTTVP